MKFVSKLLNLLLFIFTFGLVTISEWGVYNLLALPSGTENTIGFVSKDKDGDGLDDNVAYLDTYTFVANDLVESVKREPRYLIRSWFNWDWWQKGMKWADYAIEGVVGVTVPLFAPMYEVEQMNYYYTGPESSKVSEAKLSPKYANENTTEKDYLTLNYLNTGISTNTFAGIYHIDHDETNVAKKVKNATEETELRKQFNIVKEKYALAVGKDSQKEDPFVNKTHITKFADTKENDITLAEKEFNTAYDNLYNLHTKKHYKSFMFEQLSKESSGYIYKLEEGSIERVATCLGVTEGSATAEGNANNKWYDANGKFLNELYKINKYNCGAYDKWYSKFVEHGHCKSAVIALYFQFLMALIMSIWFVCQNPLKIDRNVNGENEVTGGYKLSMRHKHREKKEKRHKKDR